MLKDKKIVVAGACGRIGKALCEEILNHQGTPILADINEKSMLELKNKLEKKFQKEILFLKMDICSKRNLQECLAKLSEKYTQIDAFVNSSYPVGKNWGQRAYFELEYEELCEHLKLHLGGFILAAQEFVKFFKKQGFGNIINLSSIMGVYAPKFENYQGTNMQSALEYSVIKAGINHLGVWLAKALFNTNIRINTLSSGGIKDNQPEIFLKAYRKCCASKGMLEANDVCGTLIFLLSDYSQFITGQNFIVDDGWGL